MNYKKSFKPFFKKRYLVELASIIVLLLLASVFKITVDNLKDAGSGGKNGLATLAVNFDNLKRTFEGEVVEDMTVLDALNMAMAVGKIKLTYALDDKNQVRVMEINGHLNRVADKHFTFFLNDKQVDSKDLNNVNLKAGDRIVIKYE
ncbi:MAG: hypothetical protein HYT66_00770 [Candidatus Yanofskybacteria bacterium]|nr:hypothetical protein [Candidatus Yanofskybacteria bacterium]